MTIGDALRSSPVFIFQKSIHWKYSKIFQIAQDEKRLFRKQHTSFTTEDTENTEDTEDTENTQSRSEDGNTKSMKKRGSREMFLKIF